MATTVLTKHRKQICAPRFERGQARNAQFQRGYRREPIVLALTLQLHAAVLEHAAPVTLRRSEMNTQHLLAIARMRQ